MSQLFANFSEVFIASLVVQQLITEKYNVFIIFFGILLTGVSIFFSLLVAQKGKL